LSKEVLIREGRVANIVVVLVAKITAQAFVFQACANNFVHKLRTPGVVQRRQMHLFQKEIFLVDVHCASVSLDTTVMKPVRERLSAPKQSSSHHRGDDNPHHPEKYSTLTRPIYLP
jgi:hypothetical protein